MAGYVWDSSPEVVSLGLYSWLLDGFLTSSAHCSNGAGESKRASSFACLVSVIR